MAKADTDSKKNNTKNLKSKIKKLKDQAGDKVKDIEEYTKKRCFILWSTITPDLVEEIFETLRTNYDKSDGKLDVIVHSSGGDINAAYNLACLFQKHANKELNFIVPRWAKSAATLLVSAGETIYMSPIAELGPLDPQITQINPMEDRFEHFSPLHVRTTLDMIRDEYMEGSKDLADGLVNRLQFPLTLGGFIKSHEISDQYLDRLLKRMEKTKKLTSSRKDIANKLSKGYADHGFCINLEEAKIIGLHCEELKNDLLNLISEFHRLYKEKEELKRKLREEELKETLKHLPPDILKNININDLIKGEK